MAEGLTYVELPPIPALGPGKLLVSARDSRTLVITSGDVTRVRKLAATPQVELSAREVGEWRALDGGLVTIIANGDRIDRALPTPKAPAAATVLRDLKRFGVAFDLDAATNEAGLRLDLACGDAAAAERARTAFAELLPLATQIIEAEIKNPTQRRLDEAERKKWKQTAGDETTDRRVAEFWLEVIKSCAVRVESHDDGTARVRLASTAAFPAHIVTAYEVAEKADATKAKTK